MNYRKRLSRQESEHIKSLLDALERIVSISNVSGSSKMTMNVKDIMGVLNVDDKTVKLFASREYDPLPLKVIIGRKTKGFAFADELRDWMVRNTALWVDRHAYKSDFPRKGGKLK